MASRWATSLSASGSCACATADNPGTPIVVGTGGPGGDGLLFLNSTVGPSVNLPALYAPVLAGRDLIYFTQRGTKGATPELYCPEFDAVGYNAARSGLSEAEREEQYRATLQACADAAAAQGIDLSAYNSNENAADIDDLRRALGYDQIIYYGQSYGTVLGQFLMRNFPASLEAVILDGTQPVEYMTYAEAFDIPAAFRRVFAACAADAACNASYPDPEATLDELMAAFRANPKPVTVTGSDGVTQTFVLDDVAIMGGLLGKMYTGSATVPADIYHLKENDPAFLAEFIPTPGGHIAKMMQFAINCADDPNHAIEEFGFDAAAPLYAGLARDDAMQQVLACGVIQVPQLPDASDVPVVADMPVLLLNGGLDPVTPRITHVWLRRSCPTASMSSSPAAAMSRPSPPVRLPSSRPLRPTRPPRWIRAALRRRRSLPPPSQLPSPAQAAPKATPKAAPARSP